MRNKDFFEHKARQYDTDKQRISNVEQIAQCINTHVNLTPKMQLMDFGSGTGLLLERIAEHVKSITAVDISASMIEQLKSKRANIPCQVAVIQCDLTTSSLDKQFDGIISSMTLHHIKDLPALFIKLHHMLKPNGFIALADLKTEDGHFHNEDTGVFHFGFSKQELSDYALNSGFKNISITPASTIHKPYGDFPVVLLTAYK